MYNTKILVLMIFMLFLTRFDVLVFKLSFLETAVQKIF